MNKCEAALLGMFLGNPALELNPHEAASKTGFSYGAAYQTLAGLAEKKVLVRRRVGNANVYGLNFGSEAAVEALMRTAAERRAYIYSRYRLEGVLRGTVDRVKEELPSAHAIVLFGSVAKGEAGKESDIDLLFILPEDKRLKEQSKLISDICSTKAIETGKTVNSLTMSIGEFERMLKGGGRNVVKEIIHGGLPISGAENYFGLIARCMLWKGSPI